MRLKSQNLQNRVVDILLSEAGDDFKKYIPNTKGFVRKFTRKVIQNRMKRDQALVYRMLDDIKPALDRLYAERGAEMPFADLTNTGAFYAITDRILQEYTDRGDDPRRMWRIAEVSRDYLRDFYDAEPGNQFTDEELEGRV